MKISKLKLTNFRSYKSVEVELNDFTAFIGRNDIGKSTILEALDIFFNEGKGVVKLDPSDFNIHADREAEGFIEIAVCFRDLPEKIIIDSTYETSFKSEFLLNDRGELEVIKRYALGNLKEQVSLWAYHPSNAHCSDLYAKKPADLKKIIKDEGITCENNVINAKMRAAIWNHYHATDACELKRLDLTKDEGKNIWDKIKEYLPQYSLFQSDRKNSDTDSEVQDPMKAATKEIIDSQGLNEQFKAIATEVTKKLKEVADNTLAKLREMNPDLADGLEVKIPEVKDLKWAELFKSVSIEGNDGIAMNKRGSGVRRLLLLNFFRAKAEDSIVQDSTSSNGRTLIYAIEEPETSQHNHHQDILINALKSLSEQGRQVLITTHSGNVVKKLEFNQLRLAQINPQTDKREIVQVQPQALPYLSLNEVNYVAFGEISEEYHDELYGHLESQQLLSAFEQNQPVHQYMKLCKGGSTKQEFVSLATYIRHQIHHPENKNNPRYTRLKLEQSIQEMRSFLKSQAGFTLVP